MKQITKMIKESNLSKLKAYALSNAGNAIRAKEYKDTEFSVEGYAITEVKIIDDNDNVKEMTTLSLLTTDGIVIATNSRPMLDNFINMKMVIESENINLGDTKMIIREGKCKEGSFNSLEFVL